MKIHFFSLSFNPVSGGGSHHTLEYILTQLHKRGHDVTLTTIFSDNNKLRTQPEFTIIEKRIGGKFLDLQKQVGNLLSAASADVLCLYGPALLWAGGLYKQQGGNTPVVVYLNNYTPGMNLAHREYSESRGVEKMKKQIADTIYTTKCYVWEKTIGRSLVKKIDAVVSDSPIVKNIYENFGYRAQRSFVCPEFIDVVTHGNTTSTPPFTKKDGELHVLYAGRLTHDKGVDILVKASTLSTHQKIVVHIVGKGPQKKYLEALAQQAPNIHFYDWVDQATMRDFYTHADVFVHPCRWPEPFGRTIVEAMMCGLPIVTTSHSGSAWVAGEAGYILQDTRVDTLAQMLDKISREGVRSLEAKRIFAKKRASFFEPTQQLVAFEHILSEVQEGRLKKSQ